MSHWSAVWSDDMIRCDARHQLLGALAGAAAASLLARALGVIRGLGVAKLLPPEAYGVSATIAMILAYAQFMDLGASGAAFRTATAAAGRDDRSQADAAAGHIGAIKLAVAICVGILALAFSFAHVMNPQLRLGLRFLPAIVLATSLVSTCILQLQAFSRPGAVNRTSALGALLDLVLVLGLTMLAGLPGLLLGLVLASTFTLHFALRRTAAPLAIQPSRADLRRYVRIGFPLALLALIDHNLVYVDQVIVLGFFSVRELGVYNIALVAADVLRILSVAIGIVIGPRLIAAYSRSGGDLAAVRSYTLVPVQFCAALAPFAIAALWAMAPWGIAQFYPRYQEAIRPMQVLFLGYYFLVVLGGVTTFLFAIDKHHKGLWFLIPSLGVNVVADIVLIRAGYGLPAVAVGSTLTYVIYGVTSLCYVAAHFLSRPRDWVRFLGGAFSPALYLLFVLGLVDWLFDYRDSVASAMRATLFAECLLLPLGVRAWRVGRAVNRLR